MVGPPYAVTTVGGDVAWQLGGFGAAFVALMSMFIVGRHTRGEEQSGRSELVRRGARRARGARWRRRSSWSWRRRCCSASPSRPR